MSEAVIKNNFLLCHMIVEYIKSVGINFDTIDLEEDIYSVLASYGIYHELNSIELDNVMKDLFSLALDYEVSEVIRIMNH